MTAHRPDAAKQPLLTEPEEDESEEGIALEALSAQRNYAQEKLEQPTKRPSRRFLLALAIIAICVAVLPLWGDSVHNIYSKSIGGALSLSFDRANAECNPYEQRGVLRVDLLNQSANYWEPIMAADCQPRDYLTTLYWERKEDPPHPELGFLHDRVLLFFGDSVDRGFVEHFCRIFAFGEFERIGVDHPLSPPLPPGREHAPPGYQTEHGDTDWVGNPMGRPSMCYLPKYNAYIVNVFQFGLYPEDETVIHYTHFLPPGGVEDRFDTFVVPILELLAEKRKADRADAEAEAATAFPPRVLPPLRRPITAVPDLITLTSTFWNIMRHPYETDEHDSMLSEAKPTQPGNTTKPAWLEQLGTWEPPTRSRQDWWEQRIQSFVRHVADAWGGVESGTSIFWRTLHMATTRGDWPLNKQYEQDEVARRVVELLQAEGRAAERSSDWKEWQREVVPRLGPTWGAGEREEVLRRGLGRRLKVLDWGKLFYSQSVKLSQDGVHPDPYPGCWVYWQMLLDALRRHVEEIER